MNTSLLQDRIVEIPETDGWVGKARIKKSFEVTTRQVGSKFVCTGPIALLVEARGQTEEDAVEAYLQLAVQEYVRLNGEVEGTVVGYAKAVRDKLALHFTYFIHDKDAFIKVE